MGARTITVKGEGGAVFDVDLPPEGTPQRKQYDKFINDGRLQVVGKSEAKRPAPDPSERPAARDSREVWDAHARFLGLNPDDHKTKSDLIAAVEAHEDEGDGDGDKGGES